MYLKLRAKNGGGVEIEERKKALDGVSYLSL